MVKNRLWLAASLSLVMLVFFVGCNKQSTEYELTYAEDEMVLDGVDYSVGWRGQANLLNLISAIDGDVTKAGEYKGTDTMKSLEELCGGDLGLLKVDMLDMMWKGDLANAKMAGFSQAVKGDFSMTKLSDMKAIWGGDLNRDLLARNLGVSVKELDSGKVDLNNATIGEVTAIWGGELNNITFGEMSAIWGGELNNIGVKSLANSLNGNLEVATLNDMVNIWGGDLN